MDIKQIETDLTGEKDELGKRIRENKAKIVTLRDLVKKDTAELHKIQLVLNAMHRKPRAAAAPSGS